MRCEQTPYAPYIVAICQLLIVSSRTGINALERMGDLDSGELRSKVFSYPVGLPHWGNEMVQWWGWGGILESDRPFPLLALCMLGEPLNISEPLFSYLKSEKRSILMDCSEDWMRQVLVIGA